MNLDRIKLLAVGTEERLVSVPLTETELEEAKDNFIQDNLKLNSTKRELANVSAGYKMQMKEISERLKETLGRLKDQAIESNEVCYKVPDFDNRTMDFYTNKAVKVFSRPLRPDENQENVFSIATNNAN
jgi:hypothetical protein